MKPLSPSVSSILTSFHKRNQRKLRKLNDEIMRSAALDFNRSTFDLAVFSYILSKIVSKPRFLESECDSCLKNIEDALQHLVQRVDIGDEK